MPTEPSLAYPNTPAGRRLAAFFGAFNSGDAGTIASFISAHYAPSALERLGAEERATMDLLFFHDTGGLTPYSVEQPAEYEIHALAQERLGEGWARVMLTLAPEPPHLIVNIGARPERRPPAAGPLPRLSQAEAIAELSAFMERLVAADAFSGAVLVAKDGAPLFKQAYGLASMAFGVPNRVDTKFNLGSMNKMFTGVAIAQLAQQGRLSFDDTIAKHLPDYPQHVAEKVTIHHLLTHTAGLGSYWNEKFESSKARLRSVADFLPLFIDDPLEFEPGAQWSYSNAGFIVLGAIVERVSGQSYFDYVREHIYQPAGMPNTDAYELDQDVPNLAIGYTYAAIDGRPDLSLRRNNLFLHVVKGGPAGGGFSTVEDLQAFDRALRAHVLLNPEYTATVTAGKVAVPGDPDAQYAYGFEDRRVGDHRVVGHGGGFPGINSDLNVYLDLGYTVAVMSNYDPPAAQRVSARMRELIARI